MRARRVVLGLPNACTSSPTDIAHALDAAERGMDVADAFHVALAIPEPDAFVTFDRKVVRRGAGLRTVRLARKARRRSRHHPSDVATRR